MAGGQPRAFTEYPPKSLFSPNCEGVAGTEMVCGRLSPLVTATDVLPDLATATNGE
jgi:hypothetical protein